MNGRVMLQSHFLLAIAALLPCFLAAAEKPAMRRAMTHTVSTSRELTAALGKVGPGDTLVVRDGEYRGAFKLANSGTHEQPITIRAENPRQAVFRNSSIELAGNYAALVGFVFEHSGVTITGDRNRVAHSVFQQRDPSGPEVGAAVRIVGDASDNRIHHNEITHWSRYGFRIVQPTSRTYNNRIDHNHLHDYENLRSSNEPEAIQIGSNNAITHLNLATIIERNLIERVRIRGELLSLKTSGNMVRENSFIDIQGSVQGRHGNGNTFARNTIIRGGGLRAYGDNHRIVANRLVDTDLIVPCGDVTQDKLRKPDGTGGHPAARNQWVAWNMLEGGGRIIIGRGNRDSYAIPAQNTKLAANHGPIVTGNPELKHTHTRIFPAYDGGAGNPVLLTREMVGPGAPDPHEDEPHGSR